MLKDASSAVNIPVNVGDALTAVVVSKLVSLVSARLAETSNSPRWIVARLEETSNCERCSVAVLEETSNRARCSVAKLEETSNRAR